MTDTDYQPDQEAISIAIDGLTTAFSIVDQYLTNKSYFAGNFSLAEIHWMPYLHFCQITGQDDLITTHPNLEKWFILNKARKTSKKQLTFAVLPSLEQIRGKELRYVA